MDMLLPGFVSGLAIIVVLLQFDFKKVLGISLLVDIISTAGLAWLFIGTYSGMMSGIFGGLTVSLILALSKRFIGYKKLTLQGWRVFSPVW